MAGLAELNVNWKGDEVGYEAIHQWIKRRLPKKELCELCGNKPPYDLANISNQYKRDTNDWEWLCRKCHMKKDGRLSRFLKLSTGRNPWNKGTHGLQKNLNMAGLEKGWGWNKGVPTTLKRDSFGRFLPKGKPHSSGCPNAL